MAETNHPQEEEVKVEDLLRLKRAERPDDAFWDTFDRELHQRMLQTLVKKDPWYIQLLRGLSGRIAQTTAVGAAAAVLAMIMVRPAFVETFEPVSGEAFADAPIEVPAAAPVEVAMSDLDPSLSADYRTESISGVENASALGYTQEFALDTIEVSSYDSDAYSMDSASFAGAGLATGLVY